MFEPKNDLETLLLAAHNGEMKVEKLMEQLLESTVFMPVYEKHEIGGLQPSQGDQATPLTLTEEGGSEIVILFSSPERAKSFVKNFPGYGGGLLAELSWVIEKLGTNYGISINPDNEVGIDLEASQLAGLAKH